MQSMCDATESTNSVARPDKEANEVAAKLSRAMIDRWSGFNTQLIKIESRVKEIVRYSRNTDGVSGGR